MAELLAGTDYEEAFAEDLARVDTLGNSVEYRVNLYSPCISSVPIMKGTAHPKSPPIGVFAPGSTRATRL